MYTYHFQHPNVILTHPSTRGHFVHNKICIIPIMLPALSLKPFRITFASIKLSLADDLDNLCQPKCHSQTHVNNTSRNHTMNNLLTSDLDDLERSREEGVMWG
jgi:hypothetical protein